MRSQFVPTACVRKGPTVALPRAPQNLYTVSFTGKRFEVAVKQQIIKMHDILLAIA